MSYLISMKEWESKSALLAHMEDMGANRIAMVGIEAEAPRKFYSFTFAAETGASEIAVLSSGLGIKPQAILLKKGKRAIVGHDMWLTWIDVTSAALILSKRLNGVFFEFLPLNGDDEVIALHELGALRADANGTVIWTVDTDIVERSYLNSQGNLVLTIMDQPTKVVVSLRSGKISVATDE
ncbi:MAG: hypothetical protein AB1798_16170 [Spirochaetota bacterium]